MEHTCSMLQPDSNDQGSPQSEVEMFRACFTCCHRNKGIQSLGFLLDKVFDQQGPQVPFQKGEIQRSNPSTEWYTTCYTSLGRTLINDVLASFSPSVLPPMPDYTVRCVASWL